MEHISELNPYQTPNSCVVGNEKLPEQVTDYKACIGKKSAYYLKHWFNLRQGINRDTGFNFAALFYGPLWFLYRKMYLNFFLISALLVAEGVVEYYVFKVSPFKFEAVWSIGNVFGLCMTLAFAFYANRLYFQHLTAKIQKVRTNEYDDQIVEQRLKKIGGVDVISPLSLLTALVLVFYALITFQ